MHKIANFRVDSSHSYLYIITYNQCLQKNIKYLQIKLYIYM